MRVFRFQLARCIGREKWQSYVVPLLPSDMVASGITRQLCTAFSVSSVLNSWSTVIDCGPQLRRMVVPIELCCKLHACYMRQSCESQGVLIASCTSSVTLQPFRS